LLKVSSDGHRRGMTVLDRTRLTDRLSTFFYLPGKFNINWPAVSLPA
jgi:hypothetical protein